MGPSVATRLAAYAAVACIASSGALLASSASCGDVASGGGGGGTGGAGTGGAPGCPEDVSPLFTLHVVGTDARLPDDLQLQVSWSAGDEPAVLIADETSYGTVEDNVICVRRLADEMGAGGAGGGGGGGGSTVTTSGAGGAPPADELLCELWTSGPTRVRLDADGYLPFDDTLVPATADGCDRPVPSEVTVELTIEEPEEPDEFR